MSLLAANSPAERAEALILLTTRLTELIEKETALFESRRPLEARTFQDEKSKLATIYRREIAAVKAEPARLEAAPEALKIQLKDVTAHFTNALEANGRAVDALRVLTEGVVKSVADEAARLRDKDAGYGPGSKLRSGASTPAIAVNQRA
ncbi:flagellar basal-body protein FlbY [Hyphobacterium sp. HN65]|uniref:Flagellar basal-body protein FlbY n=1 Tax=Hyphobacterium lacteum TaxID=3116575 RepID=A0ABU7LQL5_9PROT|nr:flagellar basal-body protein FlbY [Hyphobacterium sp. HN65]MEE2526197.1 flagellar basal-body protein FlbY [Hyphobacterium sp. HN65]